MKRLAALLLVAAGCAKAPRGVDPSRAPAAPQGMVWIGGGEFTMGSADDDTTAHPDEIPAHRVRVGGFWMDTTEVTNAQFRAFVEATGYVTTAERPPAPPPGAPAPPPGRLVAASLVFAPPGAPVPLDDVSRWWSFTPGAAWRHPEGPSSSLDGKDDHPVVQVSWDDAVAYAKWAGKRLPTEAEWEHAARGGLDRKRYSWGDDPVTPKRANTFQGHFPDANANEDGYGTTSPVRAFPPNGYGLFGMAGNVWEWCADLYRPDTYRRDAAKGVVTDPKGPDSSFDPRNPELQTRVQRGGSFLCDASYCSGFRVAARMACSPDTGLSHAGFRCVTTKEMWSRARKERSTS